ncbi:MAG: YbfJ family protein [Planctomycetaceae bacterium]|jgi:hypothetical protein|nr:YbfJ family protein [Planctomycetaceae bacterium]
MKRFPVLFCLLFVFGCGQKLPDGMPKLIPVTITVTLEGQPLADADVRLSPLNSANRWVSGSKTDAKGNAVIRTHGEYKGVPAGQYKVCVHKDLIEGDAPPSDIERAQNPGLKITEQKVFRIIPVKYDEPGTTPLEIEVTESSNQMTLDIPERVKEEIKNGGV